MAKSDLTKALEDGRAARRARARAAVAEGWVPPTPTPPAAYTPNAVERLRSALEAALSDAAGDGFDTEDPAVYFDLVHAVALGARGEEHPTTIAEFLRCEGVV